MTRQISATPALMVMGLLILNGGCGNGEMATWRNGPVICRHMCEGSEGFHTIQEFNCRRIHANASSNMAKYSSRPWLICLKATTSTNSSVPLDKNTNKINCSRFHTEIVQELSEQDRTFTWEQACTNGKLHAVQYILSQGQIDINTRNRYGRTPILVAALSSQKDLFDFLLCKGSDLAGSDPPNNILHEVSSAGVTDMVKHIISMNVLDIESSGWFGWTPVMVAAKNGRIETFDYLVEEGCNLRILDESKNNILHVASESHNIEMLKRIFALNISGIDTRGQYNETPIMIGAKTGSEQIFDFLVQKGCNLNLTDKYHNTCFHLACHAGHVNIVKHILSQNLFHIDVKGPGDMTPLMTAAISGQIVVFDFLKESGANVTQVDRNNANVLHLVCKTDKLEMTKHILSQKIMSIDCRDSEGWTPVFHAATNGNTDMVKLLERSGCNMAAEDNEGGNIFHAVCSAHKGSEKMVRYLLTSDVLKGMEKKKNKFGHTPYQLAVKRGNEGIASLLS